MVIGKIDSDDYHKAFLKHELKRALRYSDEKLNPLAPKQNEPISDTINQFDIIVITFIQSGVCIKSGCKTRPLRYEQVSINDHYTWLARCVCRSHSLNQSY